MLLPSRTLLLFSNPCRTRTRTRSSLSLVSWTKRKGFLSLSLFLCTFLCVRRVWMCPLCLSSKKPKKTRRARKAFSTGLRFPSGGDGIFGRSRQNSSGLKQEVGRRRERGVLTFRSDPNVYLDLQRKLFLIGSYIVTRSKRKERTSLSSATLDFNSHKAGREASVTQSRCKMRCRCL